MSDLVFVVVVKLSDEQQLGKGFLGSISRRNHKLGIKMKEKAVDK
jgi:hypothetical protein